MIIYIESVLINNIAIDILIAYITLLSLRRKIVWWRLFIGSVLGSIYALFSPLMQFAGDIVIKILVALIMCVIIANPGSIKKYLTVCSVFIGYAFGFGGLMIGIMNMWQPLEEVLSNPNNINIGLGATLFVLIIVMSRVILNLIIKNKVKESNVKKVIISTNMKIIKEKAYYDSGNTMYYRGIYPVIVIDESLKHDSKSVGSIEIGTLAGKLKKDVYKLSKLMIENRQYDSVYCIFNQLTNGYKVLLHNDTY